MSSFFGMKSVGLICLWAVLFATVVSGQVPPKCGTSTQCSALAALRIRVNGIGRCRGTARADCFAFASASEPCFAEVSRKISLGECRPVDIEIFASCTASAVATVFANAFVSISCEGQGSGCGFAQANGEAWACSFASAVAQLLVNVNDGEAVCDVDVGAMAAVFASVATEAQAAVCTDGSSTGFVFDFEREFGSRAESIIADAAASCFVTCFPDGVAAEVFGDAGVTVDPSPSVFGNADSNEGGVLP